MKIRAGLTLGILLAAKLLGASLGDIVEITTAERWNSGQPDQTGPFPTLKVSPADGRNAELLITLLPNELAKISDEASLRALHQRLSAKVYGPRGNTAATTEIKVTKGLGVYSVFEDPTLVGKPSKRGDYKVAIPMLVWLQPDVVLQVTLFTDDAASSDLTEGLQMIQSAKAVGRAPPLSAETAAKLARRPIEIRGPDHSDELFQTDRHGEPTAELFLLHRRPTHQPQRLDGRSE